MNNIVLLDSYTLNPGDLSWAELEALGKVTRYEWSQPSEVRARAAEAEIIITNKVVLDAATIAALPRLRCICVSATGYNNINIAAARAAGIPVCNVSGYSTPGVAQHVFALLLELCNQVGRHNRSVQHGEWTDAGVWCYWQAPLLELQGQTMGIYGYGKIGQEVARIAAAFGMRVLAKHTRPLPTDALAERVEEDQFFAESDVISLHVPLTGATEGLINAERLRQMRPNAFLINTGRGGLVVEADLRAALLEGQIAGAGLDVLSAEPPQADHPLLGLDNCILTPHQAWASLASRRRLMAGLVENIRGFQAGKAQNVVN
ncbi:MAG: D-2-hydroxyacid dehydrogenase [Bacteroidota bacterium]